MGLDATVECSKIMHRSHHHHDYDSSKIKERCAKGKTASRNNIIRNLDGDSTELNFIRSPSPSPKGLISKNVGVTDNKEVKRGSVYQSSKAVRKMKTLQVLEGRQQIQSPCSSDTSSFSSTNSPVSLSYQNEASPVAQWKRPPLNSLNIYLNSTSRSMTNLSQDSLDSPDLSFDLPNQCLKGYNLRSSTVTDGNGSPESFLEICLHSEGAECCCSEAGSELAERISTEKSKLEIDKTFSPENDGNGLLQSTLGFTLPKSSSTRFNTPNSPCGSESNHSKASPKARSSPLKRILNPLINSKSLWNLPVSAAEIGGLATSSPATVSRSRSLRKCLLQEFSKTTQKTEPCGQFVMKDSVSSTSTSPAHLHGILRLLHKHGVPFFEFSLKDSDDVLAAKTWRTNNAFSWVYTFHSVNDKRSKAGGWGRKDRYKRSSIVGQMQVSCYLCSEMINHGSLDNSVVTEFVLFDINKAKKGFPAKENSYCSPGRQNPNSSLAPKGAVNESLVISVALGLNGGLEPEKGKVPSRLSFGHGDSDAEAPYPWVPTDLYPHLEVAAMVIQFPFEKRECLKGKLGDEGLCGNESPNLSNISTIDQKIDAFPSIVNTANVKVVIPSGIHGLPSGEEGGPSPLLDRWRSGGGCDCGGWDMACPIVVFDNYSVRNGAGNPLMEDQRPMEIFIQGGREKIPALKITAVDEGLYCVDFHAQLSTLQAFSICVGILHSAEVSTAVGQERNRQRLHSNSFKVLLEGEVRCLIEAMAEEERKKTTKKVVPPATFVLDRPVSPIGRV